MELYNFFTSANGQTSASVTESFIKEIPITFNEIWVLGRKYHPVHDIEDLRSVVRTKLWFSYRSGFPSIGGTGPKTDKYWGCMLRCGQMVMAQALVYKHLQRDWTWEPNTVDPVYRQILKMFQDRKNCPYSIHQIAQMGVGEGKAIGQWFGPNTIAQVLRKLSAYDEWSSIAVHVTFDNAVILSDIRTLCKYHPEPLTSSPFLTYQSSFQYQGSSSQLYPSLESVLAVEVDWRPMLLFIPLRLGLSTFNSMYTENLKNTFKIKQSLGILGGRPRHAMWLIGNIGDELICFDPHVTQVTVDLDEKFDDSSYHIPFSSTKRLSLTDTDPSMALCFYLESEEDFEDWVKQVQKLTNPEKQALFEIIERRPNHWPELELRPDLNCSNCSLDYFMVESSEGFSDEDFESLGTGGHKVPLE